MSEKYTWIWYHGRPNSVWPKLWLSTIVIWSYTKRKFLKTYHLYKLLNHLYQLLTLLILKYQGFEKITSDSMICTSKAIQEISFTCKNRFVEKYGSYTITREKLWCAPWTIWSIHHHGNIAHENPSLSPFYENSFTHVLVLWQMSHFFFLYTTPLTEQISWLSSLKLFSFR